MTAQAQPTAREMSRPEFPATVHAYTDLLQVLAETGSAMTAAALAERTGRVPSNVKRDLHRLVDAGVIGRAGPGADANVAITAKGRRWLEGMAVARGDAPPMEAAPSGFALLQHHQLLPDPNQPRRRFADGELESLARSIGQEGVLQTLLVRPAAPLPFDHPAYPGEGHMIIAGERRWRAIGRIIAAGEWPDGEGIPCRIATPEDEADALEKAMAENLVREELNHMEIGLGFEALAQAGRSNREIADRLGRSIEFVQQHRQITKLKPGEQRWVAEGMMTFHDALKVVRGQATAVLPVSANQVVLYPVNAKPAEPEPEQPVLEGMESATSRTTPHPKEDLGDGVWRDVAPEEVAGGEAAPSADMPVLSRRARLALVEIAHKAEAGQGDAQVGEYWKDKTADELVKAALIAVQHLTEGPVARLTAKGDDWLQDAGIERPVSLMTLDAEQEAGRPLAIMTGRLYATDWIETTVAAPSEAPKTATFGQVYDPRTDATAQAQAEAGEPLICDDCDGLFPTLEDGRCRGCAEKAATDDQDWRAAAFALANALTSAAQRVWTVLDHLNKLAEDCPAEAARAVALGGDLRTAMTDAARLLDAHGFPAPVLPEAAEPEAAS